MGTHSKNQKIVLGVTGGIACYKACEIVRLLKTAGYDVHVVMTKAASEFVTAMTFQALSQNPVRSNIFDLTEESQMGHIALADTADLILVAPATANFIGRVAHGLCNDLLTTVVCATKAPVWLAPAMNVNMFENPLVQENIKKLEKLHYRMLGPDQGSLACGWEGMGRMLDPEEMLKEVNKFFKSAVRVVK